MLTAGVQFYPLWAREKEDRRTRVIIYLHMLAGETAGKGSICDKEQGNGEDNRRDEPVCTG